MIELGRQTSLTAAVRAMRRLAWLLILPLALGGPASAQTPPGVYAPGDAAVTGFSGAIRPFEIEPGQDPDVRTIIDPGGPSLRIVDLRRMGGPPQAQLVGAPKPFTVSAKSIGQVFGVALDDSSPANIYVAATSAYGLSIVAPGPEGRPQHVRLGTSGATFMPAQWGPGGGPGSIWKINGATGAVTLFANVTTGDKANSGAALGGLAYDPATKSLFVADRETGLIHRFGPNGVDLGVYDHGVAGNAAAGLPTTPAPAGPGVDITNPQFDSAQPETWGYAAPDRRVFGLAIRDRRLYYAVAEGLRVWSVGLNANGSFGADARIEVVAPSAAGPTEISRITFDDEGRMFLAERPAPTGAQDFEALSAPSIGRVLRYTLIGVTEIKQPIWQPLPDEYAVGFPERFRNGNGGVAIGYSYDMGGTMNPASCGGFVWTTGEQLRHATDPKLVAQLGQNDALAIDGLQGNPIWRIRRGDEPPLLSYFIDYADAPPDLSARGHMGDIAILRACTREAAQIRLAPRPAGAPPPAGMPKPPGLQTCKTHVCGSDGSVCPPNQIWIIKTKSCASSCAPPNVLVNGQCCSPKDLQPRGICSNNNPSTDIAKPTCGVNQTAIGPNNECCENSQIYSGPIGQQLCCGTTVVNGVCDPLKPKIPDWKCPSCCAPGYVKIAGKCCLKSQATSKGQCCPAGQIASPDGTLCIPLHWLPRLSQCCASGFLPTANGKCCAPANLTTSGECCAAPVDPKDRSQCSKKIEKKSTTVVPVIPKLPTTCQPGERRNANGVCVARKPGVTRDRRAPDVGRPIVCPPGWVPGPLGARCRPAGRFAPRMPGFRPVPPPGMMMPRR
ncbi:hypothetical protein [Bradyrhizobium sp. SZCCHNS30592]|nr:hypothetical protein [Bradyrhizobium sp. SZCCHNS30592]